ncbi:MAG TPA: large conductance mechanosensitive channel protein MscL [Methanothrix sp.]|nr:large conductance mechanosensitive channel protein MscL [Methanothrix sp.]HPR65958.1 large conductance mechanosensitive channel protein MscL [Methanothrix sp.]
MGMLKEFEEFAMRGNVLDMAIGIILGLAFGKIVTSLVNDIIMPPVGMLLGDVDFTNLFISLGGQSYATLAEAQAAGAPTINYGIFINTIIDFLIVAFVIFLLVRQVNKMKKKEEAAPPNTKDCPYCKESVALEATRCPHCTSELGGA